MNILLFLKTLESEIQGRKPVLEEIVKLGEQLLSNTVVRDEEKVHIAEEMEIFEDRWSKLNVKIHENNKWYDNIFCIFICLSWLIFE